MGIAAGAAAGAWAGAVIETGTGLGAALRALAFLLTTFLFGALLAFFDDLFAFFFGMRY